MSNLFVITASNPGAMQHVEDTIKNPILADKVERHFAGSELAEVKSIGLKHGYYAWGAMPGPGNVSTWNRLQIGDHILVYQKKKYTYYTRVLFKARNREFALENWGEDSAGKTWEYMYLLEPPTRFATAVATSILAEYLPTTYMGFQRISDEKTSNIVSGHGSLEAYLTKVIPDLSTRYPSSPRFWWVNHGKSYATESEGGFMWAPNRDRGGGVPVHWSTMKAVKRGDVVLNYASGAIRAISLAESAAYDYENMSASSAWDAKGQRVDLEYHEIEPLALTRIQPFIEEIGAHIRSKNSPYDSRGGIKQGYLFDFSLAAAKTIRRIYGTPFPPPVEVYFGDLEQSEQAQANPILDLLTAKKQIILYGPPGTGKTYIARKTAVRTLEPRSGSRSNVLPPPSEREPASSWVFQANPNRYDILGALSDPEYEETMWSVNQHRDKIRSGDTAFIWMSGPSAGIYAVADITSDPRMVSGDADDDRYWRSSADVGAPRLVVGIRITRNLVSAPILKSELLGIPQLRDVEILRFAQATNFAVTQTQRAEILKLVESRSMA